MQNSSLIRLVYSSKATFKPFHHQDHAVDPHVASILAVSRSNNKKQRLYGALYYGNGYFFQCLEGEKSDVEALYQKLQKDPRHKDLKILLSEPIVTIGFANWEMKYAMVDSKVREFIRAHGLFRFNPNKFDTQMTRELVDTLQREPRDVSASHVRHILDTQHGLPSAQPILWPMLVGSVVFSSLLYVLLSSGMI